MTADTSGAPALAPVPPFALLGDAAAPVCVDGVCSVPPAGAAAGTGAPASSVDVPGERAAGS